MMRPEAEEFNCVKDIFEACTDVLEVGCGEHAYLAEFLATICANVTAIDSSEEAISRARACLDHVPNNVRLMRVDATDWTDVLPGGSFDAVVLYRALHFLADVPAFLSEARRLLKRPGGRLIVMNSPLFDLTSDRVGVHVFRDFCSDVFSAQLETYWTPNVAQNFATYCDPTRPRLVNLLSEESPGPILKTFRHTTEVPLIDIRSEVLRATVASQFLEAAGEESFDREILRLQERILILHGFDITDLLFENLVLTKTMVAADVLSGLSADFDAAEELLKVSDPPETPFKSKYAAREKLQELVERLESLVEDSEDVVARALTVHFLARIGSIDHDVEEPHECQVSLERALRLILSTNDFKDMAIIPELVCANQLGVLWCNRGEAEKAKAHLHKALDVFNEYKSGRPEEDRRVHTAADLLNPEHASPGGPEQERALELLNTHTYYYLAQVYEKTGEADRAGEYCHVTLRRQLELKEYRATEWCENAATLSHHYVVKERFEEAKQHLCAARYVLEKHRMELGLKEMSDEDRKDAEELADMISARIDRAWGKYALVMLKMSMDAVEDGDDEEDLSVENIEDRPPEHCIAFDAMEVDPQLQSIPTRLAKTFEEAREIFVHGQRLYRESQLYHTLEEHCSDFVEINQDLSLMYKVLAFFEPEPDRKCKMHKRRIDLLEAPLKELNEAMFLLVCRQLIYELAETHEKMMDIKMDALKAGGSEGVATPAAIGKINLLTLKAIAYFERYLETLKTGEGGTMPSRFAGSIARPALIAYFHLARLYDKIVVFREPDRALANKAKVYFYFKAIVDYCRRNPEDAHVVERELPVCSEMVTLLPIKIEKMREERARAESARQRSGGDDGGGGASTSN